MKLCAIPADTTREAAWVQMQVFRRMSPDHRLLQALKLSDSVRAIAAAGVRQRHPAYSEDEVRLAVIRLCLGDELFRKAYPDVKWPT